MVLSLTPEFKFDFISFVHRDFVLPGFVAWVSVADTNACSSIRVFLKLGIALCRMIEVYFVLIIHYKPCGCVLFLSFSFELNWPYDLVNPEYMKTRSIITLRIF